MKDATQNFREPLFTLIGAVVFPVGVVGAARGERSVLQAVGAFLLAASLAHFLFIIFDMIFIQTCSAYPSNVIHETLLWVLPLLPPSMTGGISASETLDRMSAFPMADVNRVVHGFDVSTWYLLAASAWVLLLGYAGVQVRTLGLLAERGPLGLGLHFGLDQWDETILHSAIARRKRKEVRSLFLDDATVEESAQDVETAPLGYEWRDQGGDHGTFTSTPPSALGASVAPRSVFGMPRDDDGDEDSTVAAKESPTLEAEDAAERRLYEEEQEQAAWESFFGMGGGASEEPREFNNLGDAAGDY